MIRQCLIILFAVVLFPCVSLAKTPKRGADPQVNALIKEAMAKTYTEIVAQQQVTKPSQKKWLHSMVALNMAYLQFDAGRDSSAGTSHLNRLIRQKLRSHLPPDIFKQPGFHYSLE